jgi:hypothetical protein
MILRCSPKMANEVVLGELGWWTLKARRDFLRLNYWGKIVGRMSPNRLVWQVYHTSRSRYDSRPQNDHKTHKWCKNIHETLKDLDMEEVWTKNTMTEEEMRSWRYTIKEKIREKEERQWKERMQQKPKLRTYQILKTKLQYEHYLSMRDKEARQVITRLRGGTNELRIEKGRYAITTRDRPLERCERRCMICCNGEIEDEMHFMLDCDVYDDLRERMLDAYSRALAKQERNSSSNKIRHPEKEKRRRRRTLLVGLIGDATPANERLRRSVFIFCKRAMRRRNNLVRSVLDQKT